MLGYYKCLGEKWNIGNQQFCKKAPRKRLIFRSVEVGLASTLLMKRCIYRGIRAFLHFRTYLFIPVILDAKTIERNFRLHPNSTEKSIRWRERQLLITFLVHQHFHFSSEPLGCHFLSLLLRFAATINPCRELFSWSTLFDKDAIVQFTGLPPLQRQSN